jgi:F0F1-type ATP synthase membrane subunit c/vacuolar-type H+-ATPase subunit K
MLDLQKILVIFSMGLTVLAVIGAVLAQKKVIRTFKENQKTPEDEKLLEDVVFAGLAVIEILPFVAVIFTVFIYVHYWR